MSYKKEINSELLKNIEYEVIGRQKGTDNAFIAVHENLDVLEVYLVRDVYSEKNIDWVSELNRLVINSYYKEDM
ncbi:hypothetical protein IJJ97_06400 [bacterium]|nr:hypothetical protein [bacterium]